ncbi:MAG TPA: serine/threonine protein phosphatase [Bacteroidales bacterium]|nr:serine/threonine protein phosphatase [Bacteroidales bacterium]
MDPTAKASINRLKLSTFKLNTLLTITKAINANLSTEELLTRYETILREDLNIGKILIFKYEKEWNLILSSGCSKEIIKRINVEDDLLGHDEISFITASPNPTLRVFDNIIPVVNNNVPIAFVLIGDIDEEKEGVSPTIKHLHFIQTLSNIIMVAIENIRLYNDSLKQEAMKKELELASKMQSMLIPDRSVLPNNDKILVSTFYHPHQEVGGDYYDFIQLNKDEFGFCIADVSGKGISAALLMSNFQANLRALFTMEMPLLEIIKKLNERVMASAKGEKFITLFIAKYSYKTRILEYVNAGHNPPLFYNIEKKEMLFLREGCVGMGMLDEIPTLNSGSLKIEQKSKLFCYTDGLVELVDEKGVTFGTKQIEKNLANEKDIDHNISNIVKQQKVLEDNAAIFDDISIIGIEFYS